MPGTVDLQHKYHRRAALWFWSSMATPCPMFFIGGFFQFTGLFILLLVVGNIFLILLMVARCIVLYNKARELARNQSDSIAHQREQRQHELLDRARTWQFELAKPPRKPSWLRSWEIRGGRNYYSRRLEWEIRPRRTRNELTLYVWPHGLKRQRPIEHTVDLANAVASELPSAKPMVSFPAAKVDSDGRITDYGPTAVLYGCKINLPLLKDEAERGNEDPWRWQVPRHKEEPEPPGLYERLT